MIRVSMNLADVTVTETETLTAGRVGLECAFTFGSGWDGLQKVAVFEGAETIPVVLGSATVAVIPPECMATAGYTLKVGAYGLDEHEAIVLTSVMAKVGKIKSSAEPGDEELAPATPELVAQIMAESETALSIAQGIAEQAENGDFNGADGVSPSASVSKVGTTATITITDVNGTTTATVSDGADGTDGTDGADGVGVVSGGTTGQLLAKKSATDYDTEWVDAPTGVFWATYGTTTSAQLEAAYQANLEVLCQRNSYIYRLVYRENSTNHYFSYIVGTTIYTLRCSGNSWSNGSTALAPNVSPTLTGTPKAPTAANGTNTTQIATTAFVQAAISGSSGDVVWVNYPDIGEYATKTAEVEAAYQAGKLVLLWDEGDNDLIYRLVWRSSSTSHGLVAVRNGTLYTMYTDTENPWSVITSSVPSPATATPSDLGTAAVGSSYKYARENHVHKMPSASDVGAVAVAQGVGHAGEFCVVGSDGNITTVTMTAWSGGLY